MKYLITLPALVIAAACTASVDPIPFGPSNGLTPTGSSRDIPLPNGYHDSDVSPDNGFDDGADQDPIAPAKKPRPVADDQPETPVADNHPEEPAKQRRTEAEREERRALARARAVEREHRRAQVALNRAARAERRAECMRKMTCGAD